MNLSVILRLKTRVNRIGLIFLFILLIFQILVQNGHGVYWSIEALKRGKFKTQDIE